MEREMFIQAMLLFLVILLSSVAANSWHVQPDAGTHNFICPSNTICYTLSQTLQLYRAGFSTVNNYILYFKPGVYYAYNDSVVFTNLQVLILQGQGNDDMPVIRCYNIPQSFTFQNITTIVIKNIRFKNCGDVIRSTIDYSRYPSATLHFTDCYNTLLHNITITPSENSSGIVTVDSKGPFRLINYTIIMTHCNTLTQYGILLNFTRNSHVVYQLTLLLYHYELSKTNCCNYVIGIGHMQRFGNAAVTITIQQLNISHVINPRVLYYYSNAFLSSSNNHLLITNSTFNRNRELQSAMFDIKFEDCWLKERCTSQRSSVTFSHCQITDNSWSMVKPLITITLTFSVYDKSQLFISNCKFNNNKNMLILKVESKNDLTSLYSNYISITNTSITYTEDRITFNNMKSSSNSMIYTQHTLLSVSRLVVTNITHVQSII